MITQIKLLHNSVSDHKRPCPQFYMKILKTMFIVFIDRQTHLNLLRADNCEDGGKMVLLSLS